MSRITFLSVLLRAVLVGLLALFELPLLAFADEPVDSAHIDAISTTGHTAGTLSEIEASGIEPHDVVFGSEDSSLEPIEIVDDVDLEVSSQVPLGNSTSTEESHFDAGGPASEDEASLASDDCAYETMAPVSAYTATTTTGATSIRVDSGRFEDVQAALNMGKDASASAPLVVTVTKSMSIDRSLFIYSNTTLVLDKGVTISRASSFDPAFSALLLGEGTDYAAGYDQFKNVVIRGGAWDGGGFNDANVQILLLRHGENITIEDTVLSRSTNHMINVSASRNVTISNVIFKDAVRHTTASNVSGFWNGVNRNDAEEVEKRFCSVEAIHMDNDTTVGEPGDSRHDGTPAGDVLVQKCTFQNVFAGAGNHHTLAEANAGRASGEPLARRYDGSSLTMVNCEFRGVGYRCVNAYSIDNVSVSGSVLSGTMPDGSYFLFANDSKNIELTGATGAVYLSEGSTGRLSKAAIRESSGNAVSINSGSSVVIADSSIENSGACGVRVYGASAATVQNSLIQASALPAVSVAGKGRLTFEGSRILGSRNVGITLNEASFATISSSEIDGAGDTGIWISGGSSATVEGCGITGAKKNGISLNEASASTLINRNTVSKSGEYGIVVTKSKGVTIRNNTVLESVNHGIVTVDSPSVKVLNNISSSTINKTAKYEILINYGCSGTTVVGNQYGPRKGSDAIHVDTASKNVTLNGNTRYAADSAPSGASSTGGSGSKSSSSTENAAAKVTWTRLSGATALDTMQAIVNKGFGQSDYVVIATNSGYWDALAASALAGKHNAPVLLTSTKALSKQTGDTIKKLGAKNAFVVGGTAAVSDACFKQIKALCPNTKRLAGKNAIETAIAIANEVGDARADTCIIATSGGYWDALSASPYAYAKKAPIYLTKSNGELSADARVAIKKMGYKRAVIVGGTAAVKASAEGALKSSGVQTVLRQAGGNALQTSGKLAAWALTQGMSANGVGLATSGGYWDALTGAALCGKSNAVLLLVSGSASGHYNIDGFLKQNKASITKGYVFGGKSAVTDEIFTAAKTATS